MGELPKIVWMLWFQGWKSAPTIVSACKDSWVRQNPGWDIRALDRDSLSEALPPAVVEEILATDKQSEAASDQIRIELLGTHGGVWSDATTLCATPLDHWLDSHLEHKFFAFEQPAHDRMIASWFLASAPGSYIVHAWRSRVRLYWRNRAERHDYFWFHQLFAALYLEDERFKSHWDATRKLPATHPFHFSPEDRRLYEPPTEEYLSGLTDPPAPVFKLTHKLNQPLAPNSLINTLCAVGRGEI